MVWRAHLRELGPAPLERQRGDGNRQIEDLVNQLEEQDRAAQRGTGQGGGVRAGRAVKGAEEPARAT